MNLLMKLIIFQKWTHRSIYYLYNKVSSLNGNARLEASEEKNRSRLKVGFNLGNRCTVEEAKTGQGSNLGEECGHADGLFK